MHVRVQQPTLSPIAEEVLQGLTSTPKTLSPKLFYDERGSELFDRITELPEYYLTETERGIFRDHAAEMIASATDCTAVVELGAGSASKTVLLLEAVLRTKHETTYIPVDVSAGALEACEQRMHRLLPKVKVLPKVLDFTQGMPQFRRIPGRKLFLFIGSSIGNFEPLSAALFLKQVRASMNAGDALLLGTDMRKSADVLIPAYDDPKGVTSEFNKNVLARVNRELGADFDLEQFAHRIIWNSELSRIEMHLESLREQTVTLGVLAQDISFARGETIHTENSYKFTMPMVNAIAQNAGLAVERTWSDAKKWFTVHLLRA